MLVPIQRVFPCRPSVAANALIAALVLLLAPAVVTAQSLFGDSGFSGQRGT